MRDNTPAASGFFDGANDVSASGNAFNNVRGDFNQQVTNNFAVSPSALPLNLYPAGKLSRLFTGHESYLRALDNYFFAAGDDSIRKTFLLHGKKGVGKTQIVLKLIEDAQDRFSNVLWIDASTESSMLSGLRVIAEALQLSSTSSPLYILSRISNMEGRWLLVFDNADVGYDVLGNYFPPGQRGCILITSRTNDWERLICDQLLSVGEMEENDAVDLFLKSGNLGLSSRGIAWKIVSRLGFMPYLIDQAGHYIHQHKCDPEILLDLAESSASEEFIMVLMKSKAESLEGKDTLDGVDADTLQVWNNLAYSFYTQKKWTDAETWGLRAVEGRKKLLGVDHLHTLLSMGNLANTYREHGKHEKGTDLWLHVAVGREAKLGKENLDTLLAYHQVAYLFYLQKKWADAERWGWKAVEGRKKVLGINHAHTLKSIENMGSLYNEQQMHEKAIEIRLPLVEGKIATLGEDDPSTLLTMHNLAWSLYSEKRWTEAETWAVKAVQGRKKTLGTKHLHTLKSMENLASIYIELRELEKLTEIRLEILEGKIALLGENDPETLLAMNNLAAAHYRQKNWVEAERWGSKAVEGRKRVLGVTHLHVLLTMLTLADTYTELDRWDKAAELYARVIEGRTAQLGAHHSLTLDAMRRYRNAAKRQPDWN